MPGRIGFFKITRGFFKFDAHRFDPFQRFLRFLEVPAHQHAVGAVVRVLREHVVHRVQIQFFSLRFLQLSADREDAHAEFCTASGRAGFLYHSDGQAVFRSFHGGAQAGRPGSDNHEIHGFLCDRICGQRGIWRI